MLLRFGSVFQLICWLSLKNQLPFVVCFLPCTWKLGFAMERQKIQWYLHPECVQLQTPRRYCRRWHNNGPCHLYLITSFPQTHHFLQHFETDWVRSSCSSKSDYHSYRVYRHESLRHIFHSKSKNFLGMEKIIKKKIWLEKAFSVFEKRGNHWWGYTKNWEGT